MKKNYVRPMMVGERFAANEYVAACGDKEYGMYEFECDAGGGVHGGVWIESNNTPGLQTDGRNADRKISSSNSSFHACNIKHEASTKDDFLEGYYLPDQRGAVATKVIIWRGPDGDNVHCTTNLNQDSWEHAKS